MAATVGTSTTIHRADRSQQDSHGARQDAAARRLARDLMELTQAAVGRVLLRPELAVHLAALPADLPVDRDLRAVLQAIRTAPAEALTSPVRLHAYLADAGVLADSRLDAMLDAAEDIPIPEALPDAVARIGELAARLRRVNAAVALARRLVQGWDDPAEVAAVRAELAGLEQTGAGPSRVLLPWRAVDELAVAGEEPPWLVEGLLAPDTVTLLYGLPKSGKSTLTSHLVRASLRGEEFLGLHTQPPSAVLWLTEERRRTMLPKVEGLPADRVRVLLRHEVRAPWPEVVAGVAEEVRRAGATALVIVDTYSAWAGLADENDAATTEAVLKPLRPLAAAGAAVLLIHHAHKASRHEDPELAQGTSARGSSALTGFADILVELRRPRAEGTPPNWRELFTISRFDQAPCLMCELRNGRYVALGTRDEVRRSAAIDELLAALADSAEGLTRGQLEKTTSIRGQALTEALSHAEASGYIVRVGSGRKGDPWRYQAAAPPGEPLTGDADSQQIPIPRNPIYRSADFAENGQNPHHDGKYSPQPALPAELADFAENFRQGLPDEAPASETSELQKIPIPRKPYKETCGQLEFAGTQPPAPAAADGSLAEHTQQAPHAPHSTQTPQTPQGQRRPGRVVVIG